MVDYSIIEECRRGNLNRFRELVKITSPLAWSVAFRMLGNEENARDVVQETMITIWQKIGSINSAEAYKTWVYRITMNKCYDKMRQKNNSPEIRADDKTWNLIASTVSDGSVNRLETEETATIIRMLTMQLSPKQKAVFVLSELEELSQDEISEATGMSKSSIKANLYFARKNISDMIEKYLE